MNKNSVEVVINNKIYTVCGSESSEYIQKIAAYINDKYTEFKDMKGYNNLNAEMRGILFEINVADDYFKSKQQCEELEEEIEEKDKEVFEIKHELVTLQTKNEELQLECEILNEELSDTQKKLIRLETELEECKKQLKKS